MPTSKKPTTETPPPAETPAELIHPVSDEVIAEVVRSLNTTARDGVLTTAIAMGRIVIENIYSGDASSWRTRGDKDTSFRKLAEHPDLGVSAALLSKSCGVYELEERLGISSRPALTATHCHAVLGLPDNAQERLLKEAEENAWTTRELEAKAAAVRKKASDGRGRPPLPAFQKTLHRFSRLLKDPLQAFGDLDQVAELEDEKARELVETIAGMREHLDSLEQAIKERAGGAEA